MTSLSAGSCAHVLEMSRWKRQTSLPCWSDRLTAECRHFEFTFLFTGLNVDDLWPCQIIRTYRNVKHLKGTVHKLCFICRVVVCHQFPTSSSLRSISCPLVMRHDITIYTHFSGHSDAMKSIWFAGVKLIYWILDLLLCSSAIVTDGNFVAEDLFEYLQCREPWRIRWIWRVTWVWTQRLSKSDILGKKINRPHGDIVVRPMAQSWCSSFLLAGLRGKFLSVCA